MARVFNGTSQYLSRASAVVGAAPLTMACWFYSTSAAALQTIMEVSRTGAAGTTDKYRIILRGDLAAGSKTLQAQQIPGFLATTTAQYSINQWHHGCGVFASASSRTAYIDGGNAGTDTTSGTVGTLGQTLIGTAWDSSNSTFGAFFSGRIAEAAIWDVELTAAEVAALARRYTPLQIRPQSLVAYWPLGGRYGQFDLDRWKSSLNMTPTNSPTWADHDRIIYPQPVVWPQRVAAAGGATPWLYARRRSQIIGSGGVH